MIPASPRGMGYPLRWNRTDLLYEVSLETIQARHLLRPSREVRDLIHGVLSRALAHYPGIRLYAFAFTRDRGTLLLSATREEELSRFMAYVAGGISRRLGRLLDWSGKLWSGRYRAVPILDEEAITQRLRFVLSRGVDEGLVASPSDWPGASCVPALLGSMVLEGSWVNRDREARLRAAGLEPPPSVSVEQYRVVLSPIPTWADLTPVELVARYRAMIESIEREYLMVRKGDVLDPIELLQQDPFFRPPRRARRRFAEICHATCERVVETFRSAYRQFCAAFRAAADRVAGQSHVVRPVLDAFPAGSNPRPELRVPWVPSTAAPDPLQTVRDEPAPLAIREGPPRAAPATHSPPSVASPYGAVVVPHPVAAGERPRPYAEGRLRPPQLAAIDAGLADLPRARGRPSPAVGAMSEYRTQRPGFGHRGRVPDSPDVFSGS